MHVMSLHEDGKVVWFLCAKPLCLHGDDCAPRQTPPKARRRSPWRKPNVVDLKMQSLPWTGFKPVSKEALVDFGSYDPSLCTMKWNRSSNQWLPFHFATTVRFHLWRLDFHLRNLSPHIPTPLKPKICEGMRQKLLELIDWEGSSMHDLVMYAWTLEST